MTDFWRQLYKDVMERKNGRIFFTSSLWVWADETWSWQQKTGRRSTDANGKEIVIVKKRGVFCPMPREDAPKSNDKDIYFVSASVCQKCQFYRKGRTDNIPYPHCQWKINHWREEHT